MFYTSAERITNYIVKKGWDKDIVPRSYLFDEDAKGEKPCVSVKVYYPYSKVFLYL